MSTKQDTGSRFFRVALTADELNIAMSANPYFLAYLQNKIEAYANQLVESSLPYEADPAKQVKAIIEHERLRNYVGAYEELLAELVDHQANQPTTNSGE
jgi:hypothetical protein